MIVSGKELSNKTPNSGVPRYKSLKMSIDEEGNKQKSDSHRENKE